MRFNNRQEYPCGLKIVSEFRGWPLYFNIDNGFITREGCPLHGKKCKRTVR